MNKESIPTRIARLQKMSVAELRGGVEAAARRRRAERKYKGRAVAVTVLEKGFEWDGRQYRSLSAVAKEVTGSHWNGLRFFNLR